MSSAAPLGRGLGRSLALATTIGMIVFGTILALAIHSFEVAVHCYDPPFELFKQSLVSFTVAAPIGIGLTLLIGRQLIRRTTNRLDLVIASASRMTGEHLEERLPIGTNGDALDRLSVALNDLLTRIDAGVAAQRQFAADASHELRTPLTVISTNLEVALRKPREAAHWMGVADGTLAEVRRMNELVEKLLELSRAGATGLRLERANLHELAAAAVVRVEPLAAEHAVRVELAPADEIVAAVDADAIAIVFDNLLRNAIAHSPAGQVVTITVGPGARFSVDDRGPGVQPEQLWRIFEPFARGVHRATDRDTGPGFGLGLPICKRIIDAHRGTITIEDRDGGGARFIVAF